MKSKKLKLLGISLAAISIVSISTLPAIVLSSCDSNNNNDNQNNTVQGTPLPTPTQDLTQITTLAAAIDFTNKYLQQNYTIDMFKNDVTNTFNQLKNNSDLTLDFEYTCNSVTVTNNKVDCNLTRVIKDSKGNITETWTINLSNIIIKPALYWDQTTNKLTVYLNTSIDNAVYIQSPVFNTLEELKAKNPKWQSSTIVTLQKTVSNGLAKPTQYFISSLNPQSKNNPKIFDINQIPASFPISINGAFSFSNLPFETEIKPNLNKPSSLPTNPQRPPQQSPGTTPPQNNPLKY